MTTPAETISFTDSTTKIASSNAHTLKGAGWTSASGAACTAHVTAAGINRHANGNALDARASLPRRGAGFLQRHVSLS